MKKSPETEPSQKDIQAMIADMTHAISRLHDRNAPEMASLLRRIQKHLEKVKMPALTARFDDLDDPAVLALISEHVGPMTTALMQDNDARSALGRLMADYATMPTTPEIRLRTSAKTHSIAGAVFAGLVIGTLVVGTAILVLAALDMDDEEEEDYKP